MAAVLKWSILSVFVVGLGSVAVDIGNGLVKPHRGCRVIGVTDGDTVRLHCPGYGIRAARLTGFDTPEYEARCPAELGMAVAATFALRWMLWTGGMIEARPRGADRYGRALVDLRIDGARVAERMVATGLARPYAGGRRAGWC